MGCHIFRGIINGTESERFKRQREARQAKMANEDKTVTMSDVVADFIESRDAAHLLSAELFAEAAKAAGAAADAIIADRRITAAFRAIAEAVKADGWRLVTSDGLSILRDPCARQHHVGFRRLCDDGSLDSLRISINDDRLDLEPVIELAIAVLRGRSAASARRNASPLYAVLEAPEFKP